MKNAHNYSCEQMIDTMIEENYIAGSHNQQTTKHQAGKSWAETTDVVDFDFMSMINQEGSGDANMMQSPKLSSKENDHVILNSTILSTEEIKIDSKTQSVQEGDANMMQSPKLLSKENDHVILNSTILSTEEIKIDSKTQSVQEGDANMMQSPKLPSKENDHVTPNSIIPSTEEIKIDLKIQSVQEGDVKMQQSPKLPSKENDQVTPNSIIPSTEEIKIDSKTQSVQDGDVFRDITNLEVKNQDKQPLKERELTKHPEIQIEEVVKVDSAKIELLGDNLEVQELEEKDLAEIDNKLIVGVAAPRVALQQVIASKESIDTSKAIIKSEPIITQHQDKGNFDGNLNSGEEPLVELEAQEQVAATKKEVDADFEEAVESAEEVKLSSLGSSIKSDIQRITAKSPISTQVKSPALHEQINIQIDKAVQNGDTEIKLALNPMNLGNVDISIKVSEGGMYHFDIKVEKRDTLELIQQDLKILEDQIKAVTKSENTSFNFNLKDERKGGHQDRQATDFTSHDSDNVEEEVKINRYAANYAYGHLNSSTNGGVDIKT